SEPFSDVALAGQTIVPKGKRRIGAWAKTFNFDFPEQGEVTTRLRDILESNVDEKYYLDEDKTAKLVAQLEAAEVGVQDAIEYDRKKGVGNIRDIALCLSSSDWRGLNRNQKQNAVAETIGLPIREATKKGYAIAEEGDSVNVQFPDSKTRRGRVGKQIANTLEASSINQGVVESPPKYRIRNLTPLECWRLQGFTDEAHETVKQAGLSDSQRYKQAGNAVTVNVIGAIGERLIPIIAGA